jgi:hypothetical protein
MRNHRDDLVELDRLLAAGRLEEAKALAFMLSRPAPELAWSVEGARTRAAAQLLSRSESIDEACRRVEALTTQCIACHRRFEVRPALALRPSCQH